MEDWRFADIPEFIPRGDGGKRRRDRRRRNRIIALCSSTVVVLTAITVFSFGIRNSRATPVPPTSSTQMETIAQTTSKTPETTFRQPETSATTIANTTATKILTTTLEPTTTIRATTKPAITVPAAIPVRGVSINNGSSMRVNEGSSGILTASVIPNNVANKGVTWKSGNQLVVVIKSNGAWKALNRGQATITVTTKDGGYKDTLVFTVY